MKLMVFGVSVSLVLQRPETVSLKVTPLVFHLPYMEYPVGIAIPTLEGQDQERKKLVRMALKERNQSGQLKWPQGTTRVFQGQELLRISEDVNHGRRDSG